MIQMLEAQESEELVKELREDGLEYFRSKYLDGQEEGKRQEVIARLSGWVVSTTLYSQSSGLRG